MAKKRIKSLPKASSALRAAAIDDNEAEAKRLIAAGENPDSVFNGITMMGVATTHGAAKVAKVLLDAGVDPNAACNQYGCGGVIDALVECGAKVNARTKSGKTALTLAKSQLTDSDTSGAVKALVKHGGTM